MRVNQEQASGSGADEQRDEHAGKAPPLHHCRGPVGNIAHKEYDGCGGSGRKHTLDMKCSWVFSGACEQRQAAPVQFLFAERLPRKFDGAESDRYALFLRWC